MFEFLKEDFEEKYNFIINQINPQVTARLNTFTTVIIGFVENILREIKPENINIYNKDDVLITKTEKIGFVNFYHCPEFDLFMKNDFGFDLREFKALKIERNRSGAHIENLNIQLDVEEIRKHYKTLFYFLKAYYEYKTSIVLRDEWDDTYFENLLKTQTEKIVEVEKLVEVEKIIEKQVVDKSQIKQKENKITELKIEAEKKNLLINDLQEKNQEYESQAKKYKKQTKQLETHYENELNKSNLEKNELQRELEKQKVLSEAKDNELKRQKSLNKTKEKEILELKNLSGKNSFQLFLARSKKKFFCSILAFAIIIGVVFSVVAIVKNSTNKLFYDYFQTETYVSVGKNYEGENLIIPSKKNGKPITKIVSNGGYGNDYVVSIEIPDSVQIIDVEAFKNFSKLKKVIIKTSSKLQKLSLNAFEGCVNLVNFYIPSEINYIAKNAFKNCTNLNYVSFEHKDDWCIDDNIIDGGYRDIQLNDETNNAQLLTSVHYSNNWYRKFEVSYNLNGGSVDNNPTSFTVADTYIINNPTRHGYNFMGWTGTGISQITKELSIAKSSTSNREYIAHWIPITYYIEYETYGGTHSNPTSYTIESLTIKLSNPTKTNSTFLGWYDNTNFNGDKISQINAGSTGSIKLYAKWTDDILIYNASDLHNLAQNTNKWSKNIVLMNDIDLSHSEWIPIGTMDNPFTGTFNGNGCVISNFIITDGYIVGVGLFGFIENATICNLGIHNANISIFNTYETRAGGLVGESFNSSILNCYSNSIIDIKSRVSAFAGGLVGSGINTTIKNCYTQGSIATYGSSQYPTLASVTQANGFGHFACSGGIIGYADNGTYIHNSFSLVSTINAYMDNSNYSTKAYLFADCISGNYSNNGQEINCYWSDTQLINGHYRYPASKHSEIFDAISSIWSSLVWEFYLNQPPLLKKV